MAKDPTQELRRDIQEFMKIMSQFNTDLELVKDRVRLILWIMALVATGTILSIIAALATILKGH